MKFIKKLVREKATIFFSSILYTEFWNVLLGNELIPAFGSKWRDEFKEKSEIIEPHLAGVRKSFDLLFELLDKFKGRCFVTGMEKLDSICMQLIVLGEALKNFDKVTESSVLQKYPQVEWKKAKGF